MLRSIPRILRRAVIVAVILAVSASVYQSWASGSPGTGGWTQTQFGPLGPADRDLLVKVRLAGLWEQPTGQQAEQQASAPEVQEVGQHISGEHGTLDQEVRKVADQLGVLLPSSPNSQQVAWMNEISQQTGSDYDRMFVQRLREAHGNILPVIAQVRASTRNELIRQFATTANEFVSRHIQYLESTGLVDYAALPQASPGLLSGGTGPTDLLVPILVFVAALLAAIALFAAMKGRNAARRNRVTVPRAPASPLPELTAVAAIPAPRATASIGSGLDTLSDTGRFTAGTGRAPTISDTGSRRRVSDSGAYRAVSEPGSYRSVSDTASYRSASDTGSHRTVSDTGSHRAVSDTGSHRAVSETGSHRAVSDTGSHRLTSRKGSRHSLRR
jgi:predicted outer membrane protein